MSIEREYLVWSTYKVTGTAIIRAESASEAIKKGLSAAEHEVVFEFSEAYSETKMRARRADR